MRKIAVDRDNVVIEARRAEAEAALALAAPEEGLGDISEDLIVDTPEESRE
jgi:DNA-directed RNA polymerase subunit beta'